MPVVKLGVQPEAERRKALCIDLLERMLAEAKEGTGFETCLFVATYSDSGSVRNAWTGGQSTLEVVAKLEYLKHGLLLDMASREEPAAGK